MSGRVVVIAPARSRRPGAGVVAEPDDDASACPFCEGREDETPPETFALDRIPRAPDGPGWRVRVVPNKFPAFRPDAAARGYQEVVVHSPRHVRSLADLTDGEAQDVATAWSARFAAAREAGYAYVQALVNEGRAAGSSLPHGHSQLVWLPEPPPALLREVPSALAELVSVERAARSRVVAERDGLVALCPPASRAPYELLVAPLDDEANAFSSPLLPAALRLSAGLVRRLHALEGRRVPLNLWVHTAAAGAAAPRWHVEIVPRLTVLAGLELGAELYVNPLPPEEAAAALRAT